MKTAHFHAGSKNQPHTVLPGGYTHYKITKYTKRQDRTVIIQFSSSGGPWSRHLAPEFLYLLKGYDTSSCCPNKTRCLNVNIINIWA